MVPGPNFIWHIDGYDKLKPYGFCIHGAVDGYSRRILWLEVGPSNNRELKQQRFSRRRRHHRTKKPGARVPLFPPKCLN